ncbi:MAG: hypothetical protein JNJ69_12405 [Leptospiraceae bacterium]|nr:hypothetical protein [Leptospiraceae bacterium]
MFLVSIVLQFSSVDAAANKTPPGAGVRPIDYNDHIEDQSITIASGGKTLFTGNNVRRFDADGNRISSVTPKPVTFVYDDDRNFLGFRIVHPKTGAITTEYREFKDFPESEKKTWLYERFEAHDAQRKAVKNLPQFWAQIDPASYTVYKLSSPRTRKLLTGFLDISPVYNNKIDPESLPVMARHLAMALNFEKSTPERSFYLLLDKTWVSVPTVPLPPVEVAFRKKSLLHSDEHFFAMLSARHTGPNAPVKELAGLLDILATGAIAEKFGSQIRDKLGFRIRKKHPSIHNAVGFQMGVQMVQSMHVLIHYLNYLRIEDSTSWNYLSTTEEYKGAILSLWRQAEALVTRFCSARDGHIFPDVPWYGSGQIRSQIHSLYHDPSLSALDQLYAGSEKFAIPATCVARLKKVFPELYD